MFTSFYEFCEVCFGLISMSFYVFRLSDHFKATLTATHAAAKAQADRVSRIRRDNPLIDTNKSPKNHKHNIDTDTT